ncbi:Regulator of chromosome condensation (RCC1)-like protein [Phytophthora palmivora]|uniref:Regulator of chromosome condensation (RCC1)-like protein n=1 Tax=Phytophthora palmivora TaxID=4796 RepID=A0A2P4XT60_9STRA|nr:Regulator of chromosome condensation (RCC1)-like protein [Phytophthora palmivora]
MLGFYQAQHGRDRKPFLAYVLQVCTANAHFLVYRRYSQIASLAAKLHFHPPVGLPPKYALQVFPLTDAQLQQRFDGLQAFLREVMAHLSRQHAAGMHHDAQSNAGLDMQIFCDFVAHHRNRPPKPVKGELPDWARPIVTTTTWADVDSVTDSEDVGLESDDSEQELLETDDASTRFRNEVLQAEGNLSALWHCVRAYMQATTAWWGATTAVVEEYKRVAEMPLFAEDETETHAARLVKTLTQLLDSVQPEFEKKCEDAVLSPLEQLSREILPEIKHTYWTRHNGRSGGRDDANDRRIQQERERLHTKLRADVQSSMTALVALQNDMLAAMHDQLHGFERVQRMPRQRSKSQPVLNRRNSHRGRHGISISLASTIVAGEDFGGTNDANEVMDANKSVVEEVDGNESDDEEEGSVEEGAEIKLAELEEEDREIHHVEEPSSHMWVWGRPPSMEGGTPLVLRPKQVSLLNGQPIVQVACGGEHLLYLTSTGDVYSYGDNEDKKATAITVATSINVTDGDLTRTSMNTSFLVPHLVEELALEKALHRTTIAMIACGAQHSLAITDAGELYTWGSGEDGRLGHGDMRDRAVPRKVMSLLRESVIGASCGGAHTAVLTTKGAVFTFGRGRNGRLGLGDNKWRDTPHQIVGFPQGTHISQVVCGWNFTAALDRQGNIFTWGKTGEGQCGLGYVDKDQAVPRCVEKLREVAAGSSVVDVACGYTHTIVLTASGELYSWGLGEYGQLGTGDVYQPLPARVQLPPDALCAPDQLARVYCGAFHSIATTEQRVMFAWGLNSYGACGLGHTSNKDKPERIDCFSSETELVVACGHKYTIALEVNPALYGQSLSSSQTMMQTGAAVNGLEIPSTSRQFSDCSEVGEDDPYHGRVSPGVQTGRPVTPPVPSRRHRRGTPPTLAMELSDIPREAIHEKEEELRRAKKLWRTRILRDWEENKDTPLAHSLWRQGIPPSIRARVWPMAIGNKLKVTPEMFKIYHRRAAAYKKDRAAKEENGVMDGGREHTLALIDTDLPRTFPSLKLFDSSGPYYAFLLEVLETYACYRPDLGYIQGMSYLAAMLCLHMPQDRYLAFQCLANLMVNEHLFTFYLLDADLANVYYTLFDTFLNSRMPRLHSHLREIGIFSCSMYLMNWLQTLFLQVLPLESAARVFDNFLLDGTVFLFRTAMAIHELLAPQLMQTEMDVALPLLQRNVIYQDVWSARVSEQALFETVATIAVPSHIYSALDRVVNDVFFYEKRGDPDAIGGLKMMAFASGGQSVGIGHVKHERRRMYAISDALNGVLGGF